MLSMGGKRIVRKKKRQCIRCHDDLFSESHENGVCCGEIVEKKSNQEPVKAPYRGRSGTGRQLPQVPKISPQTKRQLPIIKDDDITPPRSTSRDDMKPRVDKTVRVEEFHMISMLSRSSAISTASLPTHIDKISDIEDDSFRPNQSTEATRKESEAARREKRRTKLIRRKAYYRNERKNRSRSLTHIDTLDHRSALIATQEDTDRMSEPEYPQSLQNHFNLEQVTKQKAHTSNGFTVSFETENQNDEEFVQSVRGVVLCEALTQLCQKRNIDIDCISVYLDSKQTALPLLTTDTYWLSGKHLRVKVNDANDKCSTTRSHRDAVLRSQSSCHNTASNKSSSGSYRSRVSKFMNSSKEDLSSVDSTSLGGSVDGSLKITRMTKQSIRWSAIFTSYKGGCAEMDDMCQLLDNYSRHGIPRLHHLVNFDGDATEEEELYNLEMDWRELVLYELSELRQQQQSAIWELVQTEAAYIHTLKVITDLFLSCLCNLQENHILNEIETEKLFSNIQEIYAANRHFWHEHILRMISKSRKTNNPLDVTELREGFTQFEEIFHPYTRYCLDQNHIKLYCKEMIRQNNVFKAYLAWCETQKDCKRLRLVDIIAKPWQRLTKYSLLLKAILKKTGEKHEQRALAEMIDSVDVFVGSVNGSLRTRYEQERLREIINRIDSYDCVDTKDDELERLMRPHMIFDLTSPMYACNSLHRRNLIYEGSLKLRDSLASKIDVHCFLFTDMLVICKPLTRKGEKVKVIRQPYLVDRLHVYESGRDAAAILCVSVNEYSSATAAFTLFSSGPRQVKVWIESIRKAQDSYREACEATLTQNQMFDDDEEDLYIPPNCMTLRARCSSCARKSSFLVHHSHSSSLDINDPASENLLNGSAARLMANPDDDVRPNDKTIMFSPKMSRKLTDSNSQLSDSLSKSSWNKRDMLSLLSNPYKPSMNVKSLPNITRPKRLMSSSSKRKSFEDASPLTSDTSPKADASDGKNAIMENDKKVTESDEKIMENDGKITENDGKNRRISRDRLENRRYYTEGAIEDMKKQQQDRDNSIHKRLSWNCDAESRKQETNRLCPPDATREHTPGKCLSSESMYSSSGVSSVGSVHLSIGSEYEHDDVTNMSENLYPLTEAQHSRQNSKLSHHISTTYISSDTGSCSGVSYIAASCVRNTENGVKIDISEASNNVAAVHITVNDDYQQYQSSWNEYDIVNNVINEKQNGTKKESDNYNGNKLCDKKIRDDIVHIINSTKTQLQDKTNSEPAIDFSSNKK